MFLYQFRNPFQFIDMFFVLQIAKFSSKTAYAQENNVIASNAAYSTYIIPSTIRCPVHTYVIDFWILLFFA